MIYFSTVEVLLALELSMGSNKEGPTTPDATSSIPPWKIQGGPTLGILF